MSVISRVAATPNRLEIIIRVLARCGDLTQDDLLSLLSPSSLAGDDAEDGPGATATNALAEAKRLGIVVEERAASGGTVLTLAEPFRGRTPPSLLSYLEPILLDPATAAQFDQEDVPKALAWLLSQDPRAPIDLSSNLGPQTDGILSSTGLAQQFAYWARFLGYAWHFAGQQKSWLVPDPTGALGRHLPALLSGAGEVRLDTLPATWATVCPVLEGGPLRPFDAFARRFSRATSLALLRLEQQGTVRLIRLADAPPALLALEETTQTYTHVALATPAVAPTAATTNRTATSADHAQVETYGSRR